MDIIKKEEFDEVEPGKLPEMNPSGKKLSDQEFEDMLETMKNPVDSQKALAVQIKFFLDNRVKEEMASKGILSDHTRRWVETYNNILEKIQKALYGDKSVNLHLHKVTHSHIAAKIRGAKDNED